MVHPATGYLLARVLDAAPALADTLARELGSPGAAPERASRAAWETLWPQDRQSRRDLFRFGMEVLLRLDPARTRDFFQAFFSLPDSAWQSYLSDRLSTSELRSVMTHLFLAAPRPLRTAIATSALGPPGMELAGSVVRRLRSRAFSR
jgi:lycopene cyclase-like protein